MLIAHCYLEGMAPEDGEKFATACAAFTDCGELREAGEVFLDFTRLARPQEALRQLEEQLVPYLGRRLFSALAENKLIARAATLAQRDGLWPTYRGPLVIQPGTAARFLAPLAIHYLWPADPLLLRRLQLLGLRTVGQLAAIPEEELYRSFGPAGLSLAAWSRGEDSERVKNQLPCFITYRLVWTGERSLWRRERLLLTAAEYLAAEQKQQQKWGRRMELIWLAGEGIQPKAVREFQAPHLTVPELMGAIEQLWLQLGCSTEGTLIIKLGPLTNLVARQLNLLGPQRPARDHDRLKAVVKRLQERYPGCVQIGAEEKVSRREQMLAFFDPLRRPYMVGERGQDHAAG